MVFSPHNLRIWLSCERYPRLCDQLSHSMRALPRAGSPRHRAHACLAFHCPHQPTNAGCREILDTSPALGKGKQELQRERAILTHQATRKAGLGLEKTEASITIKDGILGNTARTGWCLGRAPLLWTCRAPICARSLLRALLYRCPSPLPTALCANTLLFPDGLNSPKYSAGFGGWTTVGEGIGRS